MTRRIEGLMCIKFSRFTGHSAEVSSWSSDRGSKLRGAQPIALCMSKYVDANIKDQSSSPLVMDVIAQQNASEETGKNPLLLASFPYDSFSISSVPKGDFSNKTHNLMFARCSKDDIAKSDE
ncbi:hypothetical protein TNCV_3717861 [Trichonephila clavipes]|nr:hypothetical protein TNCV_3717861 [Trichonephila clavipes]